tara:strand:+ start:96 stop:380 length:285 start_codon:yes stop_codon:yes gene_type:complete
MRICNSRDQAMTKANTTFNLDIRDVELIENALNSIITKQSSKIVNSAGNRNTKPQENCPSEIKGQIAELRDLLGRLHNQKIWYRPRNAATYIGG